LFSLIDKRAGHWLAIQVEAAKIALSDVASTRLDMGEIERDLWHEVLRSDFDEAIEKQIVSIETTVTRLLADAQLQAGEVDTVFFTGGSSGVPLLRQRIAAMFPAAQAVEGDRYGSIGSGLALDASRRFA